MRTEQRRDLGPRRGSNLPALLMLLGALATGALLYYLYWPSEQPSEVEPAPAETETSPDATPTEALTEEASPATSTPEPLESVVEEAPADPLPALSESDAYVREQISTLGLPSDWTALEDLIDRGTVVLLNVANGHLPRKQLGFLSPAEPFEVDKIGERYYIAQRSYDRYDDLVSTITQSDPETFARLFEHLSPLVDQALTQLGEPPEPRARLAEALVALAATPVIDRPIEVEPKGALYDFKEPELEALPDLQKQLIRLGPDNLSRLQRYGTDIADALLLEPTP